MFEPQNRKFDRQMTAKSRFGVFSLTISFLVLFLVPFGVFAAANEAQVEQDLPTLTNAFQVRQLALQKGTTNCAVWLKGVVLWVSPDNDQFILQDDSGGISVKMDLRANFSLQPGDLLQIKGDCSVNRREIASAPLISNDGVHVGMEKSANLFLSAGMHPISIEWFNSLGDFGLKLDCMGPKMPRQTVPDVMLFRAATNMNGLPVQGLDYSVYEGNWQWLPNFLKLSASRQGSTTNFNLQVRTRDTNVAVVFSGYFKAPRDGDYTFWLNSDDGSKLYIRNHPLKLDVVGKRDLPVPQVISPGQALLEEREYQWSEMEGVVTRVSEIERGVGVELTSGMGRAYLKVVNGDYNSLSALLHSRIKCTGISQNAGTIDGQVVPSLLVPDVRNIVLMEVNANRWAVIPVLAIQSLLQTNLLQTNETLVHVSGTVVVDSQNGFPVIEDKTGKLALKFSQSFPASGEEVEALGWLEREGNNVFMRGGVYRVLSQPITGSTNGLPLLTKVIQIKSLSRQEAQRRYPVKIQGVVTAKIGGDFVIQDSTWSVYTYWVGIPGELPRLGDYWEVEGVSSVDFAPDVAVRRATYLHVGILPEPLRPTRAELINGSLDTQYIEVQGIATLIEADRLTSVNRLTLLTREGRVRLQLQDIDTNILNNLEGALIRVRGVAASIHDANQMMTLPMVASLRLFNVSINIDEPAPVDPFAISLKHVPDLLYFDARADALRRIKINGQVLHEQQGEYFLLDGGNGIRFDPKSPVNLQTGDLVEVVGFPDMSGPSPILHEALVRVTGKAPLPVAKHLSEDEILNGKFDATLVSLRARLIGMNMDHSEQTLELQAGTRSFVARLANKQDALPDILPGSLLELSGIYAGQGGDRAASRNIDSFELLLNSSADVRVLARPSWWTLRHTLMVVGGMMLVILAGMVWITLLHRQVEERSSQLAAEIKSREQAERAHALEEERARIARDLHDELGATLTEIRFLGAVKGRDSLVPPATRTQLMEVSEKSRQMVSSLDEIVWAVNPANDSLPSLASYLRHVAEEFFRATEARCRLDVDQSLPPIPLTSEVRHNVYLVVREALNNIAKHAQAAEVWLRIHWRQDVLRIVIEDNGRGFTLTDTASERNGLANMRNRLEKIGGQFEYESQPGSGTICRISLPLKVI